MYKSSSCIEHLSFCFPSDLFIFQLDFSVFWPIWALNFLLLSILGSIMFLSFCFYTFWMLWKLVTVNKAKVSLRKTLITFSEILSMSCNMYKIEFTSWKIFTTFTSSFGDPLTSAIFIFSEAHHMSCVHTRNFKLEWRNLM